MKLYLLLSVDLFMCVGGVFIVLKDSIFLASFNQLITQ